MEETRRLLVPIATTRPAVIACIQCNAKVFSIEQPIYSYFLQDQEAIPLLKEYDLEIITVKKIILCIKTRGENCFQSHPYELVHPDLSDSCPYV